MISKYRKRFWGRIALFVSGMIFVAFIIFLIYSWIKNHCDNTNSQSTAFIISIVASIVIELAFGIWGYCNVKEIFKSRKRYINGQMDLELENAFKSMDDNE